MAGTGCKVGSNIYYSSTVTFTSVANGAKPHQIGQQKTTMYSYARDGKYLNYYVGSAGSTYSAGPGTTYGHYGETTSAGGYVSRPFYEEGTIQSFDYYTITTKTGLSNGNVYIGDSGTSTSKNVESGQKYTIRAVPNSGYVVTSISGTTVESISTDSKSSEFTASSDLSDVSAVFEPYYTLNFNANGGTGAPNRLTPCLAGQNYTIPAKRPTRSGYEFLGWATSSVNAIAGTVAYQPEGTYSQVSTTAGQAVTLYAVWKQYTLTYDANGGSTTPASQSYYGNVTLASAPTNSGIPFGGWLIDGETYNAGATYNLTSDATATAQWNGFSVFVAKSPSSPNVGTLKLVSDSDGVTVATEANGVLEYVGSVGASYRVVCELGDGKPDVLYTATGISSLTDNGFTPQEGDVLSYTFVLTAKPLYFVADDTTANAGGTLAVTNPAEPDGSVTVGGASLDAYAEGRNVTVTATPDDEEKRLSKAILYDANKILIQGGTYTGDSIVNGSFVIRNLTESRYVKGEFTTKTYAVSLSKDVASADAISAVTATSGGNAVSEVVKNTSVTFSATVASGYSFDGFYENGAKIADEVTESGSVYSVTRQISSATALVAKAKVSVTLGLSDATKAILEVNGEAYTPGMAFYVTLGEPLSYALTVTADNKYFNGWFAASDSQHANPLSGYGTTKTFAPTAAIDMVALIGDIDTSAPVMVTFAYANGSDETMGTFAVDGVVGGRTVSLEYDNNVPPAVLLTAAPKNGYMFGGWYGNPSAQGDPVSAEPSVELSIAYSRTLYACFVQNPHFICEWEGSKDAKAMIWRSKTYEASKPFNPSACRVDALGYAGMPGKLLELTVDMFSAPNSAATASSKLTNIANQNARRLPVRRMERYMQVEVKANAEVDALLVGTSMGGLAQ